MLKYYKKFTCSISCLEFDLINDSFYLLLSFQSLQSQLASLDGPLPLTVVINSDLERPLMIMSGFAIRKSLANVFGF